MVQELLVCNDIFKVIWIEEDSEGRTYFYTYPENNSFGDLAIEADRDIFIEVMFHVVRCSLRTGTGERVAKKARKTQVPETAKKEGYQAKYVSQGSKPTVKPVPYEGNSGGSSAPGSMPKTYKRGVAIDGSEFEFAPFDFTGWSQSEMDKLWRDLELQEDYVFKFEEEEEPRKK